MIYYAVVKKRLKFFDLERFLWLIQSNHSTLHINWFMFLNNMLAMDMYVNESKQLNMLTKYLAIIEDLWRTNKVSLFSLYA